MARIRCRIDNSRYNDYDRRMANIAPAQGRQKQPVCPEEVAYLELCRTTDLLSRRLSVLLKAEDLSSTAVRRDW
jgi:hypothetical protein